MDKTAPAVPVGELPDQLDLRTRNQIPPVEGGGVKEPDLDSVILCPHTGHKSFALSDMDYLAFNQDIAAFFLLHVAFSLLFHKGFFTMSPLHRVASLPFWKDGVGEMITG